MANCKLSNAFDCNQTNWQSFSLPVAVLSQTLLGRTFAPRTQNQENHKRPPIESMSTKLQVACTCPQLSAVEEITLSTIFFSDGLSLMQWSANIRLIMGQHCQRSSPVKWPVHQDMITRACMHASMYLHMPSMDITSEWSLKHRTPVTDC